MTTTPKTLQSLGGEGGLCGRVPGGPQVGTANRSKGQPLIQGQPFGDQGLPIRLGQAQARGGLEQARARGGLEQARGGPVGQVPSQQGTLGRVLSHLSLAVSAASTSVIPASGYFGSQKRQAVEINARRVICPKHARGAHGS